MIRTKNEHIKLLKKVKIIIGNGFDLHCGLKTSYKDFFTTINDVDEIKKMVVQSNLWDNESIYSRKSGTAYSRLMNLDIFTGKAFENFSIWTLYFVLSFPKSSEKRWCDIEEEMLHSFENNRGSDWNDMYIISQRKEIFYNRPAKNIICANYMKKNYGEQNQDEFYGNLLSQLEIFEKQFGEYVNSQIFICGNYKDRANEFIESFSIPNEEIISIDSFNYSNLEYLHKNVLRNINGDIDAPIFGIDSSKIKITNPAYIFTKTSRRLIQDTTKVNFDEIVDFQNVFIYGHSLNEQDYSYFFPIFDYLRLDDSSRSTNIIFAYSEYNSMHERYPYLLK